ncbi:hypothetical protein LTS18_011763, partial [Coniosporium uncinatum]
MPPNGSTGPTSRHSAVDEVTPLLAASSEAPTLQANEEVLTTQYLGNGALDGHPQPNGHTGPEPDKPFPLNQI